MGCTTHFPQKMEVGTCNIFSCPIEFMQKASRYLLLHWKIDTKKESNQNCLYALFTKTQANIKKTCKISATAPREFMMQVGRGEFYIFTPLSQRLYVSCSDVRQSISLHGFNMLTLPDGCKASTEHHIIQTSLRDLGTFDMETETLRLDIDQLLDDDKVNGKILLELMNAANDANEKLTIQDVKKKYQLKMITHHYATTSIWIYILN